MADKTIFTLRDEGDRAVGIDPSELTLTVNWAVEPDEFNEMLQDLYAVNGGGWHGQVTAHIEVVTNWVPGVGRVKEFIKTYRYRPNLEKQEALNESPKLARLKS